MDKAKKMGMWQILDENQAGGFRAGGDPAGRPNVKKPSDENEASRWETKP